MVRVRVRVGGQGVRCHDFIVAWLAQRNPCSSMILKRGIGDSLKLWNMVSHPIKWFMLIEVSNYWWLQQLKWGRLICDTLGYKYKNHYNIYIFIYVFPPTKMMNYKLKKMYEIILFIYVTEKHQCGYLPVSCDIKFMQFSYGWDLRHQGNDAC